MTLWTFLSIHLNCKPEVTEADRHSIAFLEYIDLHPSCACIEPPESRSECIH